MVTIWKYPLKLTELQEIEVPSGGELMHVDNQRGTLCLWAFVNTEREVAPRMIEIVGTGHPVEAASQNNFRRRYLGTVLMDDGFLVLHVFERVDNPETVVTVPCGIRR